MDDQKTSDAPFLQTRPADFTLQKKVGGKGALGKLFTPERIQSAQQTIEEFKSGYFEDLSSYVAELHAATRGEIERPALLESVKSLKGHAESLGFEFIFRVCNPLYAFLCSKTEYSEIETLLIQKHAEAILAGIRKKERGMGGKVEEETLKSLEILRSTLSARNT